MTFTENWYPHSEQVFTVVGVGASHCHAISVLSQPDSNRIRFPQLSRCIGFYNILIQRDTGLGRLESLLFYFQGIVTAVVE